MGSLLTLILCLVLGRCDEGPSPSPPTVTSILFDGIDPASLNFDTHFVRTVYELDTVSAMTGVAGGIQLSLDVVQAENDGVTIDTEYRAELRETNNFGYYPDNDTTQIYHNRFLVNHLDELHGPMTIFQRFNVANEGPDIELELTGLNQFFDATANEIQVVHSFGREERIKVEGVFLQPINDLKVAIYTDLHGAFKVSLNGRTLAEENNVDTQATAAGTWTQFGLYPHGIRGTNLDGQVDSLNGKFCITEVFYTITSHAEKIDLQDVTTEDLNLSN